MPRSPQPADSGDGSDNDGNDNLIRQTRRAGLIQGLSSYFIWGFMPLAFAAAASAGSLEIIAQRVVWSLIFCAIVITFARGWHNVSVILRSWRTMVVLSIASVVLALNWLGFVLGVQTDRVVEVSLGYFINPLFTVLLSVIFLRERLRPAQWVAMAAGLVAVVVIAVGYGRIPWLALLVAGAFGTYGLLKSKVGGKVGALEGMTVETAVLTPLALGYIAYLALVGQSSFGTNGPMHALILIGLGPLTAIPLILFSGAARRLPLSWVGILQYITPIMQFITGVWIMNEVMSPTRWVGFGIVWIALIIFTVDMIRASRRQH